MMGIVEGLSHLVDKGRGIEHICLFCDHWHEVKWVDEAEAPMYGRCDLPSGAKGNSEKFDCMCQAQPMIVVTEEIAKNPPELYTKAFFTCQSWGGRYMTNDYLRRAALSRREFRKELKEQFNKWLDELKGK